MARVPQAVVSQNLRAMVRGAVRVGREACLAAELDAVIGADWYEQVGGQRATATGTTATSD